MQTACEEDSSSFSKDSLLRTYQNGVFTGSDHYAPLRGLKWLVVLSRGAEGALIVAGIAAEKTLHLCQHQQRRPVAKSPFDTWLLLSCICLGTTLLF